MQKQNGKWYFHKMNGAYKSGTYKGLDLSFGNENATGGILLRAIREVTLPSTMGDFIEGPCNCVNRILQDTCKGENVKDLVGMASFSLDAFNSESNFHLIES